MVPLQSEKVVVVAGLVLAILGGRNRNIGNHSGFLCSKTVLGCVIKWA